jgi:hypothetical protein
LVSAEYIAVVAAELCTLNGTSGSGAISPSLRPGAVSNDFATAPSFTSSPPCQRRDKLLADRRLGAVEQPHLRRSDLGRRCGVGGRIVLGGCSWREVVVIVFHRRGRVVDAEDRNLDRVDVGHPGLFHLRVADDGDDVIALHHLVQELNREAGVSLVVVVDEVDFVSVQPAAGIDGRHPRFNGGVTDLNARGERAAAGTEKSDIAESFMP